MKPFSLSFKNLKASPGRTVGLAVLVALLAFVLFGGALLISSLQNGLDSLENRLGADIIVAPESADSSNDLEEILIEGVPSYFYMDKSYLDEVEEVPGVELASPQYYLASVKAACCSSRVQLVGIDPDTDFTIQPWIARSYSDEIGLDEVVVGCNISGSVGSTITFYGIECTIVAKLDETGTQLDNAVYSNSETIKHLIEGSVEQGISVLDEGGNPDDLISTVQIKVADGYKVSDVVDYINLYIDGVVAVQAKDMVSGVADSISGVSTVIGIMIAIIWVLAIAVLFVAFTVAGRHRSKEFAILRVLGSSRAGITKVVLGESVVVTLIGSIVGIALAAALVIAFSTMLESALGLPFLLPGAGLFAGLALACFVLTMIVGPAASALSASRLSKVDAGQTLREE